MRIVVELLADRQDGNLVRSQPQRELTGRMLNKHSHEAFHGAERSTVNHYGTVLLIVSTGIFQLETFRQVVGEKEAENKEVAVRKQGEGDKGTMKFEEFAKKMNEEVQNMINKW